MSGPPSAAGHIEPYGARIVLGALPTGFATGGFLRDLLERVAAGCEQEGATVVGHLKCVLTTESGRIRCNLTSLRSGATCVEEPVGSAMGPDRAAGGAQADAAVPAGATLDLAVLVYGLPALVIDRLVGDTLATLLGPAGVDWGMSAKFAGHRGSR